MTTDSHQPTAPNIAPKIRKRASAQEVIEFVVAQQQLADLDVDIDFKALARLDDMPDDEAVALIDETLGRILLT
ncbi:hypothetical protein [Streptomyces fructofermentans]|uniref:Uncharacterized protein n=1 Tax=Streptomyces fructofermentans TaxID=152141 RepID=A0A918U536_9ACTN|nr:hypothetical protein [Streptomyces fructofermentans]GGX93795.1 hypothetical protein GCM10010515_70770 [Streptomyces fructofermentans]